MPFSVFAKAGLWAWESDYRVDIGTQAYDFNQDATDVVWAVGATAAVLKHLELGISFERANLEDDKQLAKNLVFIYRF